jgi:flavin-dependent dehydrogenase
LRILRKEAEVAKISDSTDVLIMGGGLAGLTLALQLRQSEPDIAVRVVDRAQRPVPQAAHKVGEAVAETAALYLSRTLGLADLLEERHVRKMGLRFFTPADGANGSAPWQRLESGPRNFLAQRTYMLDRGSLENDLWDRCTDAGIAMESETRVTDFQIRPGELHEAELLSGSGDLRRMSARWLIDATGRAGTLKRRLGLEASVDHNVNAVWMRVSGLVRVDDFPRHPSDEPMRGERWAAQQPAMDRWRSTTHLTGPGYWVWIIPLRTDATSIGLVFDPRLVSSQEVQRLPVFLDWLSRHEPLLAMEIADREILDWHGLKHLAHGARRVFSVDRWATTGEAGVFLDPLYSPGSDYIAISNLSIGALIGLDRAGDSRFENWVEELNRIYLSTFSNALAVWNDHYATLGSPVWAVKAAWDTLVYFTVICPAFLNGVYTNPEINQQVADLMRRFNQVSHQAQAIFRELRDKRASGEAGLEPATPDFVDLGSPVLLTASKELDAPLSPEQLRERLEFNVAALYRVADALRSAKSWREGVAAVLASDVHVTGRTARTEAQFT